MRNELVKTSAAIFFAILFFCVMPCKLVFAEKVINYNITDIETEFSDNSVTYTIRGTSIPVYNVIEKFSPFRIIVDIAGAALTEKANESLAKVPNNSISSLIISDKKISELDSAVLRFEYSIADSHSYSVSIKGNNLIVQIFPGENLERSQATSPTLAQLDLTDISISSTPNSTTILIAASSTVSEYTVDTIPKSNLLPPRMFIDIVNANITELVREKDIGTSVSKVRVAKRGDGARIVFDSSSSDLFKYTVSPTKTGLSIVIDESRVGISNNKEDLTSSKTIDTSNSDATLDALIGSSEELLKQDPAQLLTSGNRDAELSSKLSSDFSFSGYEKQRITVDFYKIDVHNVFRLFREITDLNIIIDEDVTGSLTLALSDVPWDFALDIILNLMELKKEERFNTIVIYPSDKEFGWPTRKEDNLSIQADSEVIFEEALIIEQSANIPPEITEAKKLISRATKFEGREDYEDAVQVYSQAMKLWPDNADLSNKVAAIYLVNLGMNAKALYFAKQNLKLHPNNSQAALYAAISSANMQKLDDASDFFSQSISSTPPLKEALISYATFSENNNQHDAAIKLINKLHALYGEEVDTMISKARILDKMGHVAEATKQYNEVLSSGFQLRPDLKAYIQNRTSTN